MDDDNPWPQCSLRLTASVAYVPFPARRPPAAAAAAPPAGPQRCLVYPFLFPTTVPAGEEECVGQRFFACAQNLSAAAPTPGGGVAPYSTASKWLDFEACSYGPCTDCAAIMGPHCELARFARLPRRQGCPQSLKCLVTPGWVNTGSFPVTPTTFTVLWIGAKHYLKTATTTDHLPTTTTPLQAYAPTLKLLFQFHLQFSISPLPS